MGVMLSNPRSFCTALLVCLAAFTASTCTRADSVDAKADRAVAPGLPAPRGSPGQLPFDSVFTLDGIVELEEPDTAIVARIDDLAISSSGNLGIPDRTSSQVRIYDPDGRLLANLGRFGAGPGEFDGPHQVVFGSDGSLLVAEIRAPRLTRFRSDFSLDTVLSLDGAWYGVALAMLDDNIVVGHERGPKAADSAFFAVYSPSGHRMRAFHRLNPLVFEVPYWWSTLINLETPGVFLAVGDSILVTGNALTYPLSRYAKDGTLQDSIGYPPPSWLDASRPEYGEFRGQNQLQLFQQWIRTFTTIATVEIYRGSILLVSHRQLDPAEIAYREASYSADLYRVDGTKMWEDVPLPGRLLGARDYVYVLLKEPPEPWTIGRYRLRGVGEER